MGGVEFKSMVIQGMETMAPKKNAETTARSVGENKVENRNDISIMLREMITG